MSNDKSRKQSIIVTVACVLSAVSLVVAGYLFATRPKVGFVYNNRILSEYIGIKEGRKVYDDKAKRLTANLDTLEAEINGMIAKYQDEFKQLTDKERSLSESLIKDRQNAYFSYKSAIDQKIQEEDQEMTAAVLNQIDSYVIEYGKKHGYDYIFGASSEGSLFYANSSDDLTDKILKGLNDSYKGK